MNYTGNSKEFLDNDSKPIGLMSAMDSEIQMLKQKITIQNELKISNNIYTFGMLEGKKVVLVFSGIGKVNAAITAQILIDQFNAKSIWFTGVAGGVHSELDILDIVVSTRLVQHDYDTTALGDQIADVPGSKEGFFYADQALIECAFSSAQSVLDTGSVYKGVIASGDQFIADKKSVRHLKEQFDTWAVEMEGAAVAHAASLAGVPFVVIRAISDKADGNAPANFGDFLKKAAHQSEKVICHMLKMI